MWQRSATAVFLSRAPFAGLGGAVYALTVAGQSTGSVNGLGFIALAGLIFGQWRTFKILITTLFFGFALTIAQISTLWSSFSAIPPVYLEDLALPHHTRCADLLV